MPPSPTDAAGAPHAGGFLARLGLSRPELRAWAMYDWATSAMQTVIMTAVFPIYFVSVAGANLKLSIAISLAASGAARRAGLCVHRG